MSHYRNAPGLDVAMCGAREPGQRYSARSGGVTCPTCIERKGASIASGRIVREAKARSAYYREMGAPRGGS